MCGYPSEDAVCARCSTVLNWEDASCPICGRMYSGAIAVCDVCEDWSTSESMPDEDEKLRGLMMIKGMTKEIAKSLFEQGFRDFSEVIKLALPAKAVGLGLHKTIARKMKMSDFIGGPLRRGDGKCPVCTSEFDHGTGVCQKCKYSPLPTWSEAWIEERLAKVEGRVDNLYSDPDFLSLPSEIRTQLIKELGGMLEAGVDEETLVSELENIFGSSNLETIEKYREQIEDWKRKGFDVAQLEDLLYRDVKAFQQSCVEVIKKQTKKMKNRDNFACPLCNTKVDETTNKCPNCGAMFD